MDATFRKEIKIRISEDKMYAYVQLAHVSAEDAYSVEEVLFELANASVSVGVRHEAIEKMVRQFLYGQEILVAEGVLPVDGEDGYFIYNFDDKKSLKPKLREDGTVDYWSVHTIEKVKEGQLIATYVPATIGKDGRTVTGQITPCKQGREKPPLVGRGFRRSADNLTYISEMDGKIESRKNGIMITNIHEISGDVGLQTGNIDFNGDVIIHGNVEPGVTVKVTGNITIDGNAEACTLIAGKSIIIRGGMIGAEKAIIRTKGNLVARFLEYADVKAEGFIQADSSVNCNIMCYDKVYMTGKRAAIIGGYVYALRGVEAYCYGNDMEVPTKVKVGVNREIKVELFDLQQQIDATQGIIDKISFGLQQYEEKAKFLGPDELKEEQRIALLRVKIEKQAEVSKLKAKKEHLQEMCKDAHNSTVRVIHEIYPDVEITINDMNVRMETKYSQVEFVPYGDKLRMVSILDEIIR